MTQDTTPTVTKLADELTFAAHSYQPGKRIIGIVIPDDGGPLPSPEQARAVILSVLKSQEAPADVTDALTRLREEIRMQGNDSLLSELEAHITRQAEVIALGRLVADGQHDTITRLSAQVAERDARLAEAVALLNKVCLLCTGVTGQTDKQIIADCHRETYDFLAQTKGDQS